MRRSQEAELMDAEDISEADLAQTYREIRKVHRWVGNTGAVFHRLRKESKRIEAGGRRPRVLDIGCGQGALLVEIHEKLGLEVVGVDLKPAPPDAPVQIYCGDAVADPLPEAEIAICLATAHHLSEEQLEEMIRNVARSCRRLILLDMVRHPVPHMLFRLFVAPFLKHINAVDGAISIRRSFTAAEMRAIVDRALDGKTASQVKSVKHTVSPLWIRQVVDIDWQARTT
jgi:SAM-dependent methyltransferase